MAPSAHMAGVGLASITRNEMLEDLAVAAGTKALLDAGVTYSSVDQGIACFLNEGARIQRRCLQVFGMEGAPTCEVENSIGLFTAVQYIRSGQSNCILVIGLDHETSSGKRATEPVAVAAVLVSTLFLTSHAYLKDSSLQIRACTLTSPFYSRTANGIDAERTAKTAIQRALRGANVDRKDLQLIEIKQNLSQQPPREALSGLEVTQPAEPWSAPATASSETGWAGLCGLVYQLRGWATGAPVAKAQNCLQYTTSEDGTASVVILSRSDRRVAPKWQDIKNVRDGRERLGYNPAVERKAIAQEDLEAVRAKAEFTSDTDLMRLRLPVKGGDRAALARL